MEDGDDAFFTDVDGAEELSEGFRHHGGDDDAGEPSLFVDQTPADRNQNAVGRQGRHERTIDDELVAIERGELFEEVVIAARLPDDRYRRTPDDALSRPSPTTTRRRERPPSLTRASHPRPQRVRRAADTTGVNGQLPQRRVGERERPAHVLRQHERQIRGT